MDIPGPCPRCVESQRRRRNPAKGRNGAQRLFGIWYRAGRPLEQGCLIGQKRPLKPKDVWTVRVRLQLEGRKRDLAMFNLAINSKLRDCHLIRVRIDDGRAGGRVRDRATVVQTKTQLAAYMRFAQAIVWDGVWQRASWRSVAPAADSNNGSTPWS